MSAQFRVHFCRFVRRNLRQILRDHLNYTIFTKTGTYPSALVRLEKMKNQIVIFEDGMESRDFVFIDDVVDATILGLESENANNKVYNVGSSPVFL